MESCSPSGRGAIRWVSGEECPMSPLTTAQCLFYFYTLPTMTLIQTLDIASRQLYFTIFNLFSNYLLTRYIYLVSTEFAISIYPSIYPESWSSIHRFRGLWKQLDANNLTWCFTQVSECSDHEDEYDCDWHKRSPIQEIENFEQFQKYHPSISWSYLLATFCVGLWTQRKLSWLSFSRRGAQPASHSSRSWRSCRRRTGTSPCIRWAWALVLQKVPSEGS